MVLSHALAPVGLSSNAAGSGAAGASAATPVGAAGAAESESPTDSPCPPIARSSFLICSVDSCAQAAPAARHATIPAVAPSLISPVMEALLISFRPYQGGRRRPAPGPTHPASDSSRALAQVFP